MSLVSDMADATISAAITRTAAANTQQCNNRNNNNNNNNNSNGKTGWRGQGMKLKELHQVPMHLRFNRYVLSYYRPKTDWKGCVSSLFYFHNETINIVTHGEFSCTLLILQMSYMSNY